ncbi:MAG TPA: helix-turn-helix domain-containing protein [Patescibacteria group bacterium]|nr:helix-turn-helix domain-containing protein [Patescibacteria group bacterium]
MEQQPLILTNLQRHELSALVTEAVAVALRQAALEPSHRPGPPDTSLLSRQEASRLLKISLVTLYNKVKKGIIPCHRIGRRVLFKESEVLASLTPSGKRR